MHPKFLFLEGKHFYRSKLPNSFSDKIERDGDKIGDNFSGIVHFEKYLVPSDNNPKSFTVTKSFRSKTLPVSHNKDYLTFGELYDSIPKNLDKLEGKVYLAYEQHSKLNDSYVHLIYIIFSEEQYKQLDNLNISFKKKKVDEDKKKKIYDLITPIAKSKKKKVYYRGSKPSYGSISSTAYMWNSKDFKKPENVIMEELAKVAEVPTFHTYGYYGFFKPDLEEVIQQIPYDKINENLPIYVHTDYPGGLHNIVGDFHVGVTTVYQ